MATDDKAQGQQPQGAQSSGGTAMSRRAERSAEESRQGSATAPVPTRGSGDGLSGADLDRKRRFATVTEQAAAELDALEVDPRLDNRTGDQRPPAPGPLKPQQFDGPEVGHFAEHAEQVGDEFAELTGTVGDVRGMRSPGRLGRGDPDE
jgi:hypothetical protein